MASCLKLNDTEASDIFWQQFLFRGFDPNVSPELRGFEFTLVPILRIFFYHRGLRGTRRTLFFISVSSSVESAAIDSPVFNHGFA